MLWIFILVGAVILFLVLGFALKKVKEFLDILVIVLIIGSILVLSGGILIIMDAKDFQSKINDAPKKYVLMEDKTVLAGMQMKGSEDPAYFTAEQLDAAKEAIDAGDLERIRENDYKLFIFDVLSFDSVLSSDLEIPGLNVSLSREEVMSVLTGENGRAVVVRKVYDGLSEDVRTKIDYAQFELGMQARLGDEDSFKGKIMSLLLNKAVTSEYLSFLKSGIRAGHIKVYPETLMFIMIKYAPEQIMSAVV